MSKNGDLTLTKKDLLQIDATLITGIFIFLSIYSTINPKVIYDINNIDIYKIFNTPFGFIFVSITSFMITIITIIISMLFLFGKTINVLKSEYALVASLSFLLLAIVMLIGYSFINLFGISNTFILLITIIISFAVSLILTLILKYL